jgi:flagella basal body P-ring formation protein FlgA
MEQPTSDLTQRASRAAAHRPGASSRASAEAAAVASSLRAGRPARVIRLAPRLAMRAASRVLTRVVVSVALWVAGGIVLLPGTSQAQEAGGPIVIPGPAEQNPGALADIAQQMRTPSQRAASATSLAAATAQSIGRGPAPRDADPFTRAAGTSGAIVIPGANEPAAAPAMIRTNFKPDANGVVTIPAPGNAGASANVARVNVAPASRAVMPVIVTPASATASAAVQPVDAGAPQGSGFDSLASRGEPPQFGANGKPLAPAAAAMPSRPVIARTSAVRQPAPAVAQKYMQAAALAQPATLPGQQDAEAIHAAALAFLQQQSAGLPGKIDITVAAAFPRGLSACAALEPFMPTGARLWGRMTVGVRCAGERPWTIYLQARVSLHATYYLAARAMAPGEVLTAADLVARDGDLTGLPQAIVTDPSQAVGSVSLVRIAGGMPLRRDMLKSASAVAIGQTVRVVAAGDGFSISAEGSAMNNASPGQQVRVKTANGQVISGIVKDGATVEIQL